MVEVEWLEPLVIEPLLMMVVLCGYLLTIKKLHETKIERGN
jgi:hypothetical protein